MRRPTTGRRRDHAVDEPGGGEVVRLDVTVTIYQPRKGEVDVPLADFDTAEFRGTA
jgi:hypothetical protein